MHRSELIHLEIIRNKLMPCYDTSTSLGILANACFIAHEITNKNLLIANV